jgi:hypothetical protein
MWPALIYISGPISADDADQVAINRAAFHDAQQRLQAAGYAVCSPLANAQPLVAPWLQHMRADIKLMMDCDAVAILPGWHQSRGAGVEVALAKGLGLPVAPLDVWLHNAAAPAR